MEGLKSVVVEDFRTGIMEMDIGMDLTSESSAITARRMGISLMIASRLKLSWKKQIADSDENETHEGNYKPTFIGGMFGKH
jgi:hypothetical protein